MTRLRLALATILLCCWAGSAAAQPGFPPLSGRVVDSADLLLPADEQTLTAKLEALEKATGRQLVIATIPDLQGYAIEDYGYQLGRNWGIGRKDLNDGALLIVAPNERKVRVEVGYGLEPVLTDALSSVIIQQRILPAFRQGNMAQGITQGADALIAQLRLPDEDAKARVAEAEDAIARQNQPGPGLFFWIVVVAIILMVTFFNRGLGRRFRGGRAPVVLWGPGLGGGWRGGGGGVGGGGFSGRGGSFGGGGASGGW